MGKKDKEKKKLNPKRERYEKFRKDKPAALDLTMPDLTDEQRRQKREDEMEIERFLRFNRKKAERFVNDRKARSKR